MAKEQSGFSFSFPPDSSLTVAEKSRSDTQEEVKAEPDSIPSQPSVPPAGPPATKTTSAKEVALQSRDILELIFATYSEMLSKRHAVASRNQCLLWAALTSRAFLDPALDMLWMDMEDASLFPLLKILPAFRHDGYTHILQGPISAADWKTFDDYAKRVRVILTRRFNQPQPPPIISPDVYVQLGRLHPHPLLPGLKKLCLRNLADDVLGTLTPLFLCTSESLSHLSIHGVNSPGGQAFVSSLLSAVCRDVPRSLTALSVEGLIREDMVKILPYMTRLSMVEVDVKTSPPPLSILSALCAMKDLKSLSLSLQPTDPLTPIVARVPLEGFSSLEMLRLTASGKVISTLLRALWAPMRRLQTLNLEISIPDIAEWTPKPVFLAPISLKHLSILLILQQPQLLVHLDISSLYNFCACRLQSLKLSGFMLKANREEIVNLCKTTLGANIETLRLPCFLSKTGNSPGLRVLEDLAAYCPKLQDLSICVDMAVSSTAEVETQVAELQQQARRGATPAHPLRRISIAAANPLKVEGINEAIAVSQYIDLLFPGLEDMMHYGVKPAEWWNGVFKLLRVYKGSRPRAGVHLGNAVAVSSSSSSNPSVFRFSAGK